MFYLTYNTYGNWLFALNLRGKRLIAFVLVGIATAFSTISFQTMTNSQFLTPNILGLDSLYILIQTGIFFFFRRIGTLENFSTGLFFLNVLLMVGMSLFLAKFLLGKRQNDLFLLLMIGMILGTFFNSISTFLQVMMDPNEYEQLQGKLFASFGNVNSQHLMIAGILILCLILCLWIQSTSLDVLHLGKDQAMNLGIYVPKFQLGLIIIISTLIGLSTALVGSITFLGFIVANTTYQLVNTYKHQQLFIIGSLVAILFLVLGQFLIEQIFQLNATLSTVIEFIGGLYFVFRIIGERKQQK
ncbi:putative ABC transporter permease protein YclO [Melissococcus plutonius]|uniref:Iron compound ABC uptake transporter permease protein n=1 Tax=Melissococcus plutonius (strain ATCC 35311 / DSM 29964 / CIP 104052 / LMG 20360 / NCIMB 702443) TaxID=940190 RepID=F3Y8G9_MELPT|nr:iron chelate uptake ABC transporter family permease subunit [Melissococcus plutonius]AIM24506.1 putative ABC transporter permease protein YclO [Melissococcus plutonius S1]KMT24555.1 putative ABC transporter permease protein YclO [Melissococcus plutonius]KMT27268.1 putative ABC transporter permease protein YclO [Melissococcus plutonius]KMT27441.1 putative ABC transporter permease protein YclO [Melissococcus plutonius]KMT29215.1 putative ABC transporter permease protein YclO [Melissococcus pl